MSAPVPTPIRLTPADAGRYARLRLRMLTDTPWAFGSTPDTDPILDLAYLTRMLAEEHDAIFAVEAPDQGDAQEPPELVAAAGVRRPEHPHFAHRAGLWGVYVEPAHRGRGLGRAVVAAAVAHARTWPGVESIDLGVSENSPEARRLYESLGFEFLHRDPAATEYQGRRFDEIYMALKL